MGAEKQIVVEMVFVMRCVKSLACHIRLIVVICKYHILIYSALELISMLFSSCSFFFLFCWATCIYQMPRQPLEEWEKCYFLSFSLLPGGV